MTHMHSLLPAEARFLVVGSKAVGKSALTVRFLTKRFIGEYQSISQLTYRHTIKLGENSLTFEIRDTIEKKELETEDLVWADAFLVVYSVTDKASFKNAIQMVEMINESKATKYVALVGNKKDLTHFREVSTNEGQLKAEEMGCMCFEVSAAENYDNVQEGLNALFTQVSVDRRCLEQEKEKERKNTMPQNEKKKQKFGNSLFNWKNEKRRAARRAETI